MTKKKFYVTTPIYYPNDVPHVGNSYTIIAADIIARWHRLKGEDVFFLTGTDEHGKKIERSSENAGKKPKAFVDELVAKFKEDWKKLNLTYDRFIRTTDKDHEKIVSDVLQKVYDKGDLYLGKYEGFYCVPCEAYYTEKDLEKGCCPVHKKKAEKLKEETYFFRLGKYKNKLITFVKNYVFPEERRNEILYRLENEELKDLSISRKDFDWGIKLPFDKKHVCYVWFDALLNYYSATREKGKEKFWPADLHLVGKDILWFHAVYWPAMLISAGIELPEKIFAHGWWTVNGEKISKTTGNVINVDELVEIAGLDSARYFLFREVPFGNDGDFSKEKLIERNNELADKLGNLVSRVSALVEKYGIEKCENKLLKKFKQKEVEKHLDNLELDKALSEIFAFLHICNEYIQEKKPWETKDKKILFELVEAIRKVNFYLSPFMPETSEKIAKIFKMDEIKKSEILFKKI
jgi:methionyl-tRNA synthetase